jgi:hypothetical protein
MSQHKEDIRNALLRLDHDEIQDFGSGVTATYKDITVVQKFWEIYLPSDDDTTWEQDVNYAVTIIQEELERLDKLQRKDM